MQNRRQAMPLAAWQKLCLELSHVYENATSHAFLAQLLPFEI
jgi:hypothetical protein